MWWHVVFGGLQCDPSNKINYAANIDQKTFKIGQNMT